MSHTDNEERQIAHDTALELDAAHNDCVTKNRIALWNALNSAHENLKEALSAHTRLSSGEAWDVEFDGNREFFSYLNEVLRLLTITRALMPTAMDGTTDTDPTLTKAVRALMSGSHIK